MKLSIPNLIVSCSSIVLGFYLFSEQGAGNLLNISTIMFGILLLSLNEPLQYNTRKHIKLMLGVVGVALMAFAFMIKKALKYEDDVELFWLMGLVLFYSIYWIVLLYSLLQKRQ